MSDILEKYFEIAISIFMYVTSAVLTLTVIITAQTPIITQGQDKTFIDSTGVQQWADYDIYGRDLLLMLLNTDPMSPYPKAIKINDSPVIEINNEYIAYKMRNVSKIYSDSGEYKLSTMLDWKVTSEEYVYSGEGAPYIHYVLEEVTDE